MEEKKISEVGLDLAKLKIARNVLRALNHQLRQRILSLLDEQGELNVTRLYVILRLEQSVVSQHLVILLKAGLVHIRRSGRFIFYSINYEAIGKINRLTKEIAGDSWRLRELLLPFLLLENSVYLSNIHLCLKKEITLLL